MNRNMMKKMTTLALAGTMAFSLVACGGTAGAASKTTVSTPTAATQEIADNSLGGWELNAGALSLESNAAAKGAFEKATNQLDGYEYEAIALLGTQVVAGTNYSILAKGSAVAPDASPVYEVITIYQDLEGNAKLTGSKTLIGGEGEDGGFTVNNGEYDPEKNEDVMAALGKVLEKTDGAGYEAVAYLGSQVVQGTNYLVLMRETPVVPDAEPEFVLVTVNEDLDGNAEMTETEVISLSTDGNKEENTADSENVQIADPFEGFASLKEATAVAGFEMSVPDAPKGYETAVYRVDAENQMIEVIYSDKNLDEEDSTEAYRIRKAVGSDDISGDYNEYAQTKTETIDQYEVTMKGNSGTVSVATWTANGYSYAVDVSGAGMSVENITDLIQKIQ